MKKIAANNSLSTRTLTLDLPACERIVAATTLEPAADAAKTLEAALIGIVPNLIRELDCKPIPNTYALRNKIATLRSATNVLFERIGLPRRNAQPSRKPLPLSDIVVRLADRPGGPDHDTLHRNMRKLTAQVFWLQHELDELEIFYNGNNPRHRQDILKGFGLGLLSIYREIFNRRVATSRTDDRPSGPSFRFVTRTFHEVAELAEGNKSVVAADFFRSVPSNTIDGWIREFKSTQ